MPGLRCLVPLMLAFAAAAPAAAAPPSVKRAATQLFTDMVAGRRAACRAQFLTHAEFTSLSTKAIAEQAYEAAARRFLEKRIAELAEAGKRHGKVTLARVEIRDVRILTPKSSKLKRTAVHVVVVPYFKTKQGERGGWPFYYLQVGETWKFTWRK